MAFQQGAGRTILIVVDVANNGDGGWINMDRVKSEARWLQEVAADVSQRAIEAAQREVERKIAELVSRRVCAAARAAEECS